MNIILENEEILDISANLERDFLKGDKGDRGIQGDKGDKGDTGDIGPSNVLVIGTVEKGEEASATITGESPSQILNLVLPKGDKGDVGEQGIQGEKGDSYVITEEDKQEIEGNVKIDIQPILEEIENIANQAEIIAKGRATGYVFDTLEDLELWLQDKTNTSKLILGDNLYIRALGVPDYWWDGATKQVLETEKPDLTAYAKTEQFVTLTQAEYDALEVKSTNTYYFIIEEE